MYLFIFVIKCALLLSIAVKPAYPASCSIKGVCNGVIGSAEFSESFANCVLFGRSMPGVTWVSYNLENGICTSLEDCPFVNTEVPPHVSSEIDCPICSTDGQCVGTFLTDDVANSTAECLEKCNFKPDCTWFTYNQDVGLCLLLESCENINSEHQWISGEVNCPPVNSTTTTPECSTTVQPTTSGQSTPTTTASPSQDFNTILWIDDSKVRLGIINHK